MTIAPPGASTRHRYHPGLAVLFFTEMWERFSFYCMLSILALYMDESLHFSTGKIGQIYGGYIGLVYFTPLIGGWLADQYLGYRKAILIGGVLMCCGHLCLAFTPLVAFFAGLAFLIAGNGMFKPNISTILGNLYRDMPEKRDNAYSIFYMGINLGALFSPLVASSMRHHFFDVFVLLGMMSPGTAASLQAEYGFHCAFGAASVGMVIALAVFIIFRKHVAAGELSAAEREKLPTSRTIQLTDKQEWKRILTLLIIFAVVIVFWMAFEQSGFTLTFWARDNTNTSLSPELFQMVNPAFILIFTPLLVLFWYILRSIRLEPPTAVKIALGMLLTAAAYGIMTIAGRIGGDVGRVNVSWLIGTYAVITFAELCLSPMGLSLVSKLAPPRLAGMLMGAWFAATAVGSYLAGLIGGFWDKMNHSTFFAILAVACLAAFGVLMLVIRGLHGTISEAERMEKELAENV